MALKTYTKFEGKLTRASKNDMKNFAKFSPDNVRKIENLNFYRVLLSKIENRGVMSHENEEWCKNSSELDLSIQNWHEEFDHFSPKHLKISKICTLMSYFWPKYIMFELKKVQRSYVWLQWILMQNLKENWLVLSKRHEEFGRFSPEHVWKSKIWDFYWFLLSKVENVWA